QIYAAAALAALAARAFARFAASFALASGDSVRLAFPRLAPAPDFAWNAAHRLRCAAAMRSRAAALSVRLARKGAARSLAAPLPAGAPFNLRRISAIFASI